MIRDAKISDAEMYVIRKSKILYYIVWFFAFVVTIYMLPYIQTFVTNLLVGKIAQPVLLKIIALLVAYLAYMYLVPMLLFMLVKMSSDDSPPSA